MGHAPAGAAVHDPLGHLADSGEAGHHHRVGGQRTPGGVHVAVVAEAERLAQDELLVAERRVQLGDLGYWPPGAAFCIFFGPTPASRGDEIRPASAVNVVPGQEIRVEFRMEGVALNDAKAAGLVLAYADLPLPYPIRPSAAW